MKKNVSWRFVRKIKLKRLYSGTVSYYYFLGNVQIKSVYLRFTHTKGVSWKNQFIKNVTFVIRV